MDRNERNGGKDVAGLFAMTRYPDPTTRSMFSVILAPMAAKTRITLVGAGNLAHALGPALKDAGYQIDAVAFRPLSRSRRRAASLARELRTNAVPLAQVTPGSDIIWLCHTDDALLQTAK